MENTIVGYQNIQQLPKVCGVLRITHLPTESFFLVIGDDIRGSAYFAYGQLKLRKYHNPKLQELVSDVESEIAFSYYETADKEQARLKRHALMRAYYGDGRLLNDQDWPKLVGAYKLVYTPTGQFYVGTTDDLIKQHSYQFTLLKTGKHKSPALQALYASEQNMDNFKWTWVITNTKEEAQYWTQKWKEEDPERNLNSKRFHGGVDNVGAYMFVHRATGYYYIGSAADLRGRVSHHQWALKKNCHTNHMLQAVYNKHGDDFEIKLMPTETREEAYSLEQQMLDRARKDPICVNFATDVKSPASAIWQVAEYRKRITAGLQVGHNRAEVKEANSKRMKDFWSSRKETILGGRNPFARPVVINGVYFESVIEGLKTTGISRGRLKAKVSDPLDTDTYYPTKAPIKELMIDGNKYESINDAMRSLSISFYKLSQRLCDPQDDACYYVGDQ